MTIDENQLAVLYAEFSKEDSELAEAGMSDYADTLAREDAWRQSDAVKSGG